MNITRVVAFTLLAGLTPAQNFAAAKPVKIISALARSAAVTTDAYSAEYLNASPRVKTALSGLAYLARFVDSGLATPENPGYLLDEKGGSLEVTKGIGLGGGMSASWVIFDLIQVVRKAISFWKLDTKDEIGFLEDVLKSFSNKKEFSSQTTLNKIRKPLRLSAAVAESLVITALSCFDKDAKLYIRLQAAYSLTRSVQEALDEDSSTPWKVIMSLASVANVFHLLNTLQKDFAIKSNEKVTQELNQLLVSLKKEIDEESKKFKYKTAKEIEDTLHSYHSKLCRLTECYYWNGTSWSKAIQKTKELALAIEKVAPDADHYKQRHAFLSNFDKLRSVLLIDAMNVEGDLS